MYRDSGSLWQAENQSLREKLLRLGHSPAELQGTASENIIEEASDSIVGKPIISLPFGIVYTTHLCWFYHQKWFWGWFIFEFTMVYHIKITDTAVVLGLGLGPEDWQPKASHHAAWGTQCAAQASDEGTKAGNSHSTWCVEHDHFMINILYIIYIYIYIKISLINDVMIMLWRFVVWNL